MLTVSNFGRNLGDNGKELVFRSCRVCKIFPKYLDLFSLSESICINASLGIFNFLVYRTFICAYGLELCKRFRSWLERINVNNLSQL